MSKQYINNIYIYIQYINNIYTISRPPHLLNASNGEETNVISENDHNSCRVRSNWYCKSKS